jgi:hypothetical protein
MHVSNDKKMETNRHIYFYPPVWTRICRSSWLGLLNVLLHSLHLWSGSRCRSGDSLFVSCVIMCSVKCPSRLNALPHVFTKTTYTLSELSAEQTFFTNGNERETETEIHTATRHHTQVSNDNSAAPEFKNCMLCLLHTASQLVVGPSIQFKPTASKFDLVKMQL